MALSLFVLGLLVALFAFFVGLAVWEAPSATAPLTIVTGGFLIMLAAFGGTWNGDIERYCAVELSLEADTVAYLQENNECADLVIQTDTP